MAHKGQVITVLNQKGGVGKTTTTVNLASSLAIVNKKVLVIDLDAQGNASTSFGVKLQDRVKTVYNMLFGQAPISECITKTVVSSLDLITSDMDLVGFDTVAIGMPNKRTMLQSVLAPIKQEYDYIFIDCPPSLNLLSLNALIAACSVLIPVQCEFFALEGLSHLLQTIEATKQKYNPNLRIYGILLTMYDRRNKLTEYIEQDLRSCFKELVFKVTIPRNVKMAEAPSYGMPSILYDHLCSGSKAYINLAREILEQENQ